MSSVWKYSLVVIVSALIGYLLGHHTLLTPATFQEPHLKELRKGSTGLVNPLLECDPNLANSPPKLKPLRDKLTTLLQTKTKLNGQDTFSIYYKDLNSGEWFGINQDLYFAAASLSKVPIMVEIFKLAEQDPSILEKKIIFDPNKVELKDIYNNLDPEERMKPGSTYSVIELLKKMVQQSDNIATAVLIDGLKLNLSKVFSDFGISYEKIDGVISLTSKSYGAIFRILYNSTFLSESNSTRALELLTQSEFNKGIRKPLPDNFQVANKFGARNIDSKGSYQLHDCGIVYKPGRPYLLCVMTKGTQLEALLHTIQEISETIYKGLNEQGL